MSERQCSAVGSDQESAGSQLDQGCKDRREIEFGARVHDMELQPEDAGSSLRFCVQVRKVTSIRWSILIRSTGRRAMMSWFAASATSDCCGMLLYFCGEPRST